VRESDVKYNIYPAWEYTLCAILAAMATSKASEPTPTWAADATMVSPPAATAATCSAAPTLATSFKKFIIENGVFSTAAGMIVGIATVEFIKALVADLVMPLCHRAVLFVLGGLTTRVATKIRVEAVFVAVVNWVLVITTAFVLLELVFHQVVLQGQATGSPGARKVADARDGSAATPGATTREATGEATGATTGAPTGATTGAGAATGATTGAAAHSTVSFASSSASFLHPAFAAVSPTPYSDVPLPVNL
jgi:large-conductance mechanosensitive channel